MLDIKILNSCDPANYKDGFILYEIKTNLELNILKNELIKKGFYFSNDGVSWANNQFISIDLKSDDGIIKKYILEYSIPFID